jgi:hypothetical protein
LYPWENKAGQLSLLKWFVTIPPEQLDLTRTQPVELLEDLAPLPSKSINLVQLHPCWLSLSFLEAILSLSLPEFYAITRSMVEPIVKTCPEALMIALAQVHVRCTSSTTNDHQHSTMVLGLLMCLLLAVRAHVRVRIVLEPRCHGIARRLVFAVDGHLH